MLVAFNQQNVYCGRSPLGYGFTHFAKKHLEKGQVVVKGYGRVIDHQTGHFSIQMEFTRHFLPTKWTGRYWNHSCEANCYARTRKDGFPELVALRNIPPGDEITYSYYMTEYQWCRSAKENTLRCLCKTDVCNGQIMSFFQLPEVQKRAILDRGTLSDYLKSYFPAKATTSYKEI